MADNCGSLVTKKRYREGDTKCMTGMGLTLQPCDLLFDDCLESWQSLLNGFPHKMGCNIFIVVAIDIARRRHLPPCDRWVPGFQRLRQTARGF